MDILQDYLERLKAITAFDSGTSNYAGVTKAAALMKAAYESIGFAAELVDLGDKAGRGLLLPINLKPITMMSCSTRILIRSLPTVPLQRGR